MYEVGRLCYKYRKYILKITLKEMCELTSINISTLSAFELGRSGNMQIFFEYVRLMNNEQREAFFNELELIINAWKES